MNCPPRGRQPSPRVYNTHNKQTHQMLTANFAVQPASFGSFDEWGAEWATDINHAYRLAATYEEDAIIWRCPHVGEPTRWVRVQHQGDSIQAC